ncbi:SusC/RagA family TonB-linked outer membrane protein [Niabella ginsenosidivorans]|uniref:SusC/RagA family TonB-linked outer membrane protein n=2 Tax=Niabella ginsenosidivorans TaxID=1176587 RepID=A0A1A9I9Z3_9BACT|nr:SusC/RagA family TonB-linked outer membrane protein [Niabella ginsenosidivorans]
MRKRRLMLVVPLLLLSFPLLTAAQIKPGGINGKVITEQGDPLNGVTVTLINQTNREGRFAVSDENGNFSFANVTYNQKYTLVFEYVGYQADSVTQFSVRNESENNAIVMRLKPSDAKSALNEVVVVGYGTQKKINLTGAVSVVDGEALANRPVVNATQSLQGLVPGLNVSVNNKGGTPGTSYNLNIRGQGNLSSSDNPYVLVDGMEMSLSDVNPNDIESISVLKDAAASSIYGARAAYGVILVTTKKGSKNKMSFNYNGNVGVTHPAKLPDMVNSYEFAKFFNAGWKNVTGNVEYSDEKLALLEQFVKDPTGMNQWPEQTTNWFLVENSPLGVGNTNNFKLQYKDLALKQDHNLSATGGNDKQQYYVSGGYYDEDGLLHYADINYKRYNLNARLTSQLASWLKLNLNTKYSNDKSTTPFGDNAVNESMFFHNLARMRPTNSPYDLNGHFTELSQIPYLQSGSVNNNQNNNLGILSGFEIQPLKNWKIFVDYNYRLNNNNNEQAAIPATIYGLDGTTRYEARQELAVPLGGSYYRSMTKSIYNSINIYSNYNLNIANTHHFTFMAGGQQDNLKYSNLWSKATDLLNFSNPGLGTTSGQRTTDESRNGWATLGFFGRINYDYKGKYLFEGNARYDGSSRFSPDNRWGFFPSVSVGYNISKEQFMSSTRNWLNMLKLRGSYGFLGNQAGAALYTFAQTMSTQPQGSWFFQNGREMIINAPGTFNPDVTWEKIESADIAIDFGMLNNRLTGSFDVYQRTTRDMLGPTAKLADMFGASAPQANNATMRNRGWELSINYNNKINNNLSYSVGGMLSDYTAQVLSYQNPTLNDPAGTWYPGKKVGEIWGYKTGGLIQTQQEADEYNKLDRSYLSGQNWIPGDVKYLDLNNDNKINRGSNKIGDMGDLSVIGNSTPRYQYALSGSLTWKHLSLSMLWQGVGKRDYNPAGSVYFWGAGAKAQVTVFQEHLDYWTPDNPNAYYPNPYIGTVGSIGPYAAKVTQAADRYIQNGAYLRLKNLTLSYNIPGNTVSKIGLKNVTIYGAGENLLTFTKMAKMFDPETVFVFNEGGKNYALTQTFSIGLNVSF